MKSQPLNLDCDQRKTAPPGLGGNKHVFSEKNYLHPRLQIPINNLLTTTQHKDKENHTQKPFTMRKNDESKSTRPTKT